MMNQIYIFVFIIFGITCIYTEEVFSGSHGNDSNGTIFTKEWDTGMLGHERETTLDDFYVGNVEKIQFKDPKDSFELRLQRWGMYDMETIYNISKLALELCPSSDFCFMNRTVTVRTEEVIPCCKNCYCDDECGNRMDCCFDFLDEVHFVETNHLKCIKAQIAGSTISSKSYYMVDYCSQNTSGTCRNKSSALWGQIYPVFSPTSKLIYYNQHCALCNHISDAIPWGVYINCHRTDTIIGTGLLDGLAEGRCEVHFQPSDTLYTDKFICSNDVVTSCNTTVSRHIALEEACALTKAEIKYASGLSFMTYANVFCKLCNGIDHLADTICFDPSGKSLQDHEFMALLDWELFSSSEELSNKGFHGKNGMCGMNELKHPTKKECRVIFCPVGSTRTPHGCHLYTKLWFKKGYQIHVILTPVSQPYVQADALRREIIEKNSTEWLDSKGIKTDTIAANAEIVIMGNISYVRSMNIIIGTVNYPLIPSDVLNLVQTSLSKHWSVRVDNKTYLFDVNFDKYLYYIQNGQWLRTNIVTSETETEVLPKVYEEIDRAMQAVASFYITKMFFCNQVALTSDEWIFDYQGIRLNLSGSGRDSYLGDAEFNLIIKADGTNEVQICVEDFNSHFDDVVKNLVDHSCHRNLFLLFVTTFLSAIFYK